MVDGKNEGEKVNGNVSVRWCMAKMSVRWMTKMSKFVVDILELFPYVVII